MNRTIQAVRNLMKARTKLGAFDNITQADTARYTQLHIDKTLWQLHNSPIDFIKVLNAVNPEDIKSFYPLLRLCYNADYRTQDQVYGPIDWVTRYNSLVDRMREGMRHALGVIEYVKAAE